MRNESQFYCKVALRLVYPPLPGPLIPLSTKEMEQRVLRGPTQPQESYDFMSPWLLSLDKLSSPQDHERRS